MNNNTTTLAAARYEINIKYEPGQSNNTLTKANNKQQSVKAVRATIMPIVLLSNFRPNSTLKK